MASQLKHNDKEISVVEKCFLFLTALISSALFEIPNKKLNKG